MIPAAAVAVALAAPSRDALIQRWLQANKTHSVARLHAGPATAANASVPDLRALAQRELATPGRYQLTRPAAALPKPWWVRVWDWLAERWEKLWRGLFGRVHVGKQAAASIGDVLLAIVALILLVTIVRLLTNISLARQASARLQSEPLSDGPSPRALYRQACEAASRGDYGTAVLLLFAATVTLLDRQGAIAVNRSATVGDLRRDLRGRDATLVAPFDAVAAPFVQKAYAERTVDEPQWLLARRAFERIYGPVST